MSVQVWEIVVPGWVPSADLGLNGRRRNPHWSTIRKLQDQAKEMVGWALMGQPLPVRPLDRAHVTMTFVFPNRRRRDLDNLAGRVKPCLDALVGVLIADDSTDCIQLTIRAEVAPKVTETRIHVAALPF